MQNLYGREPVAPAGWVTLHADVNYRSPRDIVDAIVPVLARHADPDDAATLLAIETASPIAASDLDVSTWSTEGDEATVSRAMLDVTMRAITKALGAGFRRHDIALVTFVGRDRSALLSLDALGPHPLRRFTGTYDLFGNPEYTTGEVTAETIYRFKGQSAPCIVFTEIDFESVDARAVRKLFVGATRATHKLMLVTSDRAARALQLISRFDHTGAK
jgi:hypothetical protein